MLKRYALAAASVAILGAAAAPAAIAAPSGDRDRAAAATVAVLERPENRFDRAIDAHQAMVAERRERRLRRQRRIRERRERRAERQAAAAAEAAAAESQATAPAPSGAASAPLESIAACESGGDPGAVNSAGYYGKYQFDVATWQSVGGSGNPAEASEAEQDRRAAMLYSRAGASPWPVCGS